MSHRRTQLKACSETQPGGRLRRRKLCYTKPRVRFYDLVICSTATIEDTPREGRSVVEKERDFGRLPVSQPCGPTSLLPLVKLKYRVDLPRHKLHMSLALLTHSLTPAIMAAFGRVRIGALLDRSESALKAGEQQSLLATPEHAPPQPSRLFIMPTKSCQV